MIFLHFALKTIEIWIINDIQERDLFHHLPPNIPTQIYFSVPVIQFTVFDKGYRKSSNSTMNYDFNLFFNSHHHCQMDDIQKINASNYRWSIFKY